MKQVAQIIFRSVMAPRSAVDLALENANSGRVGWIMVAILAAGTLLAELFARHVLRPAMGKVEEPMSAELAWLDSPFSIAVLIAVYYVFVLLFSRWFWRRATPEAVKTIQIEAAIVVGLAASFILLFPQYFLIEYFEGSSVLLQAVAWLAPVAVIMGLSAVYFSHALNISMSRAFWMNVLQGLICTISFIAVGLVSLVLWLFAVGLSTENLFDAPAVTS